MAFLILLITFASLAGAAPLQLSVLVRTNNLAPGSGAGLRVPDGRFTWAPPNASPDHQFGPPVAAAGGRFAFQSAARLRDANTNDLGVATGIWGGVHGSSLTTLFLQGLAAPPFGSNFTRYGQFNINELGQAAFFAETTSPVPNEGLWWGNTGTGSVAALEVVQRIDFGSSLPLLRVLQSGNYIGFSLQGTNWLYNISTRELRAVARIGMAASVFGPGVTVTSFNVNLNPIVALTTNGQFLLQGNTSDGTNRLFLVNDLGVITPVMSEGQVAPGLPNRRIGAMSVSGNDQGNVAVLVGNLRNAAGTLLIESALFAGPATNVSFVAQSLPARPWGGGTFITRSNYVYGYDLAGAPGTYKLPASTNETLSFTPIPAKPYPPLAGQTLLTTSLNALGQYVELYGNTGEVNQKNPGNDLWLFNPGEGWTNVARSGSNIVASGETIRVNDIGFVGNFAFPYSKGGGYPSGLTDDGVLVFSVSTHIITTGAEAAHDFYWTGLLGPNWHTTNSTTPFTSWESVEKNPHHQPPGDAEPNTARVFINAFPGETIVLDQRPTSIGSLKMSNGLLRLVRPLTLHQLSSLSNSALEGTLILSDAALRTGGEWTAHAGTITNSAGASPVQNSGLLRKEGTGNFTIHPPYNAFEALLRIPPWGIEVDKGRLSLLGGGFFLGYHTNMVKTNATLELAGDFEVRGEETHFQGEGDLELGSANADCHLRLFSSSQTVFDLGGHTARFNRGALDGLGRIRNDGRFLWRRGTIAGDLGVNSEFVNEGTFEIDSAMESRSLGRNLLNNSNVVQQGTIQSSATIHNRGAFLTQFGPIPPAEWKITRSADILSSGPAAEFVNFGSFLVEPESPGVANVDVIFESRGQADPFVPGPAVICGNLDGPNPDFTLRFRGDVRNYDASERELTGGYWAVGPGCTMDFAGKDVEVIDEPTAIFLNAGDMPSLKLAANYGFLRLTNKNYSTPGALLNAGTLVVSGSSILTITGAFQNYRRLQCLSPAIIDVKGDAELDGRINLTGEIRATGVLKVQGQFQASGVLRASSSLFVNEYIVGASPGVLNIVGSMIETNTTVLVMELFGTAANQYDRLIVSSNAHLAGTLVVNLVDGFRPGAGDTFPILQAGSITGRFANATNGQRIATIDGYGSLIVTYTPTSVVLSAFQLNPNPPPTAPANLQLPTFTFDGKLNLALTGSPGRGYILQSSADLIQWLSLLTNNAGFDGQLRFELPTASEPYQFFRTLAP